ncbi:hypothetical protein F511_46646 [Dorcoceras hygrometricum]|uniref:Uncharacterized protein n=1 Tax=Dorcoceras hygrometricum TaxID=472368 RepID=A0A2Z7A0D2_9LAMI|nr:hypothetical protein F511_46646 [Dorcoceras hygrometricum]
MRPLLHTATSIARHGGAAARMTGRWNARDRRVAWRTSSTWSAALVAAARALLRRAIFMAAPPSSAAAPASFRRCRDG